MCSPRSSRVWPGNGTWIAWPAEPAAEDRLLAGLGLALAGRARTLREIDKDLDDRYAALREKKYPKVLRLDHAPSAPPLGPLAHFMVRGWLLPVEKPTAYHFPFVGCLRTCTSTTWKLRGAVTRTKLLGLSGGPVEMKCRITPLRKFSAYRCQ